MSHDITILWCIFITKTAHLLWNHDSFWLFWILIFPVHMIALLGYRQYKIPDISLCVFTLRYRQLYEHGTAIGQCGSKWLTDPKPVQPGYPVKIVDVGSWNSWKRGFVTGLAKFSGARSDERRLLTAEVSPSPLLLLRLCKSKATEYQNSLQNQSPIKHCFVSVLYGTLTFLGLVVHIISIQVKERGNAHCPRRLLWYFFLNLWRIVSLLFTVWTFQYDLSQFNKLFACVEKRSIFDCVQPVIK